MISRCSAILFWVLPWLWAVGADQPSNAQPLATNPAAQTSPVAYIDSSFENASPLFWQPAEDGSTLIHLIYDLERNSPNRANGHWLFRVEAPAGSTPVLVLTNFDNVWNGRKGSPISTNSHCYLSPDGRNWEVVSAQKTTNNTLRLALSMQSDSVYVARMEPYRLSDLARFLEQIEKHPLVGIETIGKTVEGRDLEIVRVGNPDAPRRVLLRARAHAWEAGGNWVLQGMTRRFLQDDDRAAKYRERFCLYLMPMANKDGVARGRTRFNSRGRDLNRQWDQPADADLCPENHALESWLRRMIQQGRKPDLAIDLHNDNSGGMHISRPAVPDLAGYLARMKRLEALMRQHTWFTEGSSGGNFRNPGSLGEGFLERFGIDALILELNCDWIKGLQKPAFGRDWELLGEGMLEVFAEFLDKDKP